MKNKNIKKILSITLTILIVLSISGLSLAYYLARIQGSGKELTSTSGSLSVNYNDEKEIQADNLLPGWTTEKTLTVTNNGDAEVKYNLYWSCIENELERTQDLTYTITENNKEIKTGTFPTEEEEKTIIEQTIGVGEEKTYTVKIEYIRSNEDQSIDMGKIFRGIINVQPEGAGQKNECPSESYTVQIEPSEMVDVSTKEVSAGENATFTYTGTLRTPKITCTNNQSGKIEGNIITINKVTNNTTCSISSSKHTVQIKVENGTTTETEKEVNTGEETTFKTTPNTGYSSPTVTCTNNQKGIIQNNTVTVSNITNDTTCTVTYKPITYTITYNLGGGSVTGNPATYTIETNTITLKNPTKTGYTFTGWTGSNGSTAQTTVKIPKGSIGNKTYTANYKINTYKVNVTVLNGTITGSTSKTVNYNTNATFTVNPSSGYGNPTVSCTNGQKGSMNGNTLTVSNVKSATTCTVSYTSIIASEVIIAKATSGNSEGLITIEQPATGQTPAQTEYRYSGSNDVVKNYVTFNNETWRIIGVFPTDDGTGKIENRVKIVREESIVDYSWDTSAFTINYGNGINQWGESGSYNGADLMRLLNPGYESESVNNSLYWNRGSGTCYNGYYNGTTACDFSSTGLTENAKEMIEDAVWYTSASNYDITASESYAEERASTTTDFSSGDGVTRTTNWTGKVGLMYPSDYGYASSGCRNGEQTLYNYDNETCTSTNWLYNSDYQWLLSPLSGNRVSVLYVNSTGNVNNHITVYSHGARLVIYLSSSVKITGGNGTLSSPYELEI